MARALNSGGVARVASSLISNVPCLVFYCVLLRLPKCLKRRRRFLKIGGTGLAGAVLLGTAGCGVFQQGGRQGGDPGGQGAFSYSVAGEIPDMDPTTMTDVNSFRLITNVMEGLYRIDENEKPQPRRRPRASRSALKG